MTPKLSLLAAGMTTAVGLTAEASCAALRARLDGFNQTRFMARGGEWLIGAEVPLEEPWRGVARMARLLAGPLQECLAAEPGLDLARVPLLIGTAEPDRPGRFQDLEANLQRELEALLGFALHAGSRFIPQGRVSAATGIQHAAKLLAQGVAEHVVVAGVDTYLVGETLRVMDEQGRLLTPANSNGFIPGEAAAALLVAPPTPGAALGVLSLGLAIENATVMSEEPLRADGLMKAFRQALGSAGLTMAQIGYRIGTMSGEQYWFKEFDLATSRLLRGRHEFMDLWHPSDGIGETGAASLPCCLAVAWMAARKAYAAGDPVLVCASNDDGRRAALILAAGGG